MAREEGGSVERREGRSRKNRENHAAKEVALTHLKAGSSCYEVEGEEKSSGRKRTSASNGQRKPTGGVVQPGQYRNQKGQAMEWRGVPQEKKERYVSIRWMSVEFYRFSWSPPYGIHLKEERGRDFGEGTGPGYGRDFSNESFYRAYDTLCGGGKERAS